MTVTATGIRISFNNPITYGGCNPTAAPRSDCNLYRVGEFEAHYQPAAAE